MISDILRWQSKPHNLRPIPDVLAFLEEGLTLYTDQTDLGEQFWNISHELEPREREDEKMRRLLEESGFL